MVLFPFETFLFVCIYISVSVFLSLYGCELILLSRRETYSHAQEDILKISLYCLLFTFDFSLTYGYFLLCLMSNLTLSLQIFTSLYSYILHVVFFIFFLSDVFVPDISSLLHSVLEDINHKQKNENMTLESTDMKDHYDLCCTILTHVPSIWLAIPSDIACTYYAYVALMSVSFVRTA